MLEGSKTYSKNLTAVVTVTDSGRSSGVLRENLEYYLQEMRETAL